MFDCYSSEHFAASVLPAFGAVAEGTVMLPDSLHHAHSYLLEASKNGYEDPVRLVMLLGVLRGQAEARRHIFT